MDNKYGELKERLKRDRQEAAAARDARKKSKIRVNSKQQKKLSDMPKINLQSDTSLELIQLLKQKEDIENKIKKLQNQNATLPAKEIENNIDKNIPETFKCSSLLENNSNMTESSYKISTRR